MWDLNRAERKALGTALFLVGLGLLTRVVLAPDPGELAWQPAGSLDRNLDGLQGAVVTALLSEQRAQTPLGRGERIDVNRAPIEELRRLPGVGQGLAEAIVRRRGGFSFRAVADLETVPGIGEVTAERLAPYVSFGAPAEDLTSPVGLASVDTGGRCGGGGDRLDVNRAGPSELERLPGVGPVLAGRIARERASGGPFETTSDLTRVSGIGPRSLAVLEPHVCTGMP